MRADLIASIINDTESGGVYTIYANPKEVHCREMSDIEGIPGEVEVEKRDCSEYPYAYCKVYKGVKFYCLAKTLTKTEKATAETVARVNV